MACEHWYHKLVYNIPAVANTPSSLTAIEFIIVFCCNLDNKISQVAFQSLFHNIIIDNFTKSEIYANNPQLQLQDKLNYSYQATNCPRSFCDENTGVVNNPQALKQIHNAATVSWNLRFSNN